jgi:hypothetical protein
VPDRGLFTGNRGIIHDPETRTLLKRRWSTRAWIICLCAFRGRRRSVMATRSWTELFFLDEVTALAAGHRPCHFCRRADARRFALHFARGLGRDAMRADAIDRVLHGERIASGGAAEPISARELADLPDGAMVEACGRFHAMRGETALVWSFGGYVAAQPRGRLLDGPVVRITPASTCRALAYGYRPVWHPSAGLDGAGPVAH